MVKRRRRRRRLIVCLFSSMPAVEHRAQHCAEEKIEHECHKTLHCLSVTRATFFFSFSFSPPHRRNSLDALQLNYALSAQAWRPSLGKLSRLQEGQHTSRLGIIPPSSPQHLHTPPRVPPTRNPTSVLVGEHSAVSQRLCRPPGSCTSVLISTPLSPQANLFPFLCLHVPPACNYRLSCRFFGKEIISV